MLSNTPVTPAVPLPRVPSTAFLFQSPCSYVVTLTCPALACVPSVVRLTARAVETAQRLASSAGVMLNICLVDCMSLCLAIILVGILATNV